MKKLSIILSLLLGSIYGFSQETTPDADPITMNHSFALYLLENRKYDEVIFLLNQSLSKTNINISTTDSLHYILGIAYYYKKELEQSAIHLSKVSLSSAFYIKSSFFCALDYIHLGAYDKAQTILENFPDSNYRELVALELAGISLLRRDFKNFNYHADNFAFDKYYYTNSENQLINAYQTLSNHKPKSMWLAGTFSALLPGSGQLYAGEIGAGVASFLTVGSLAIMTAENWIKDGPTDWKTITFGTLFSIFYIGNIYGSVASVKIYRDRFNEKQNNIILLGIHIPIRTLFE